MVRIRQITQQQDVAPEHHGIFDSIAASRGRVGGPFAVLLNSPEVAGRAAHLGAYLRFESTIPDADKELAIITAAREFDCEYEWGAHEVLARKAGVREEAISVVANKGDISGLSDSEALIVSYGREILVDHRVSKTTYDAATAKYGEQGVTELTVTFGYYGMLACALNAFEVEPTAEMPKLP